MHSQDEGTVLGEKLPVLDFGFVRLVDYMGSDQAVAYYSFLENEEFTLEERIAWCFRQSKLSPLEQNCVVFQIRLPIYVMGQLVRHRTAKLNSFSARYAKVEDHFHEPSVKELRIQSALNKQVGAGVLGEDISEKCADSIRNITERGYHEYLSLLEKGLCREQARIVLPQSMYTTIFWKMDLRNLFHFLRLRLHKDAQKEIQLYAEKIGFVISKIFPICWKYFNQIYLAKILLSSSEIELLKRLNIQW